MSELTKGPWKAKQLATYQEPGWVVMWPDKGGTYMRRLDYQGNYTSADAAVIAAAPELLDACERMVGPQTRRTEQMLEIVGRVIGGLIPGVIKSLAARSRLKIICGWGHEVNGDGVGNFLALWVKIINPTSSSIYFERLEAIDQSGKVFFPSVYRIKSGDEIEPQRNIVGIIPCGHVTKNSHPKELHVYDSTERKCSVSRRMLRKVVEELEAERERLEALNMSVHPTHPQPK